MLEFYLVTVIIWMIIILSIHVIFHNVLKERLPKLRTNNKPKKKSMFRGIMNLFIMSAVPILRLLIAISTVIIATITDEEFEETLEAHKTQYTFKEVDMERKATYLEITIYDNDFYYSLVAAAQQLHDIFQFEEHYPTEEEFPALKEAFKHMWYGTHMVQRTCDDFGKVNIDIEYLEPKLKFVNFAEIPEWANDECAYIPMFNGGSVIAR